MFALAVTEWLNSSSSWVLQNLSEKDSTDSSISTKPQGQLDKAALKFINLAYENDGEKGKDHLVRLCQQDNELVCEGVFFLF